MNILFLDQSGKPGGAELCLLDIAKHYRDRCLVGLLADGSFRELLEQQHIPVKILTQQAIQVQKESGLWQGLKSMGRLLPLMQAVATLACEFDVIYANTQKALVVAVMANLFSKRPLVYHLHDIVSADHFSGVNRQIIITLANRFASTVIANSQATQLAFVAAGGRQELTTVVYNGFQLEQYQPSATERSQLRDSLALHDNFVIGHFSRLSPWKGQHLLLHALAQCPETVTAIFVGDALFGEDEYVQQLHQLVDQLKLQQRVTFLGFRSDVPQLMAACDLVAHTSTAPEPFGRVIVEAMLCGTPIIAAGAGGATELIEHGKNGWLVPPDDCGKLAEMIYHCYQNRDDMTTIAQHAQQTARDRFNLAVTNQQINHLLQQLHEPQTKDCPA
jgi:glycosyltransferase involved in cell wall biosynthesis